MYMGSSVQDRVGYKNMCFVHVSLVPTVGGDPGEQKTKPTQHSVSGQILN
jgi:CTP synthase